MNALNIFLAIFIIGGIVGNIYSQVEPNCPICFRNSNGMCRVLEVPCLFENITFIHDNTEWKKTELMDCFKVVDNEVKVCFLDCENIYRGKSCPSTSNPVCGYSEKTNKCKKFANSCLFKQDACSDENIKDWRVAHITACQLLQVGGPAGECV